ncbi:sensor histidine kinase [Nocardioides nematodiphilus]|uniref:sensor histidine kinase n=1 Tax=Nocardioides nematodiphilus TaxID=2849669 RepID=UPI001CD9A616|nr:HAMP domain-containing sensor histidine kinase [Nocardioides nematodiphilus]
MATSLNHSCRPGGARDGAYELERSSLVVPRAGMLVALPRAAVLVLLPLTLALALVPEARNVDGVARAQDLTAYPLILLAGITLYFCQRIAGDAGHGRLAAGIVLLGSQGVGLAAIRVARPVAAIEHRDWSTGIDVSFQVGLLLLTVLVGRQLRADRRFADPVAVSVAGAVVLVAARAAVLALPSTGLAPVAVRLLAALALTAQVGTAVLLLRAAWLPHWFRAPVAGALSLLGLSHFLVSAGPFGEVGGGFAVAAGLLGAMLLLAASFALLEVLLERSGDAVVGLNHRVDHLEADARVEQEHRHEVGSTFAGIANGIHLLRSPILLTEDRRRDLETMLDAEAARLQRLMDPGRAVVSQYLDLDGVLNPLVAAHRIRGRVVHWRPSGLHVRCRADDIAQVVNILLENVARHGGTAATLTAARTGDGIEIRVTDRGPGIDPALAEIIFLRGHRGTLSHGEGFGLHIAHRLMIEHGGGLRLVQDATVPGASFVARLPRALTAPLATNARERATP